ncbi:sucrose transport protein SUC2-like [Lotus japonicus]|uniref:sucrose transport protein SUC2-like n=1 Tax=Lotus japonicus TaxID=34305 RepID=UPI002582AB03|nr:sucrose transport protein SUC2-like [Lotus japonicus]
MAATTWMIEEIEDPTLVEAAGVKWALKWAKGLGFDLMLVETDSLLFVKQWGNNQLGISYFDDVVRELGAYGGLHHNFSFTETEACDQFCANLKSCFFISITLLIVLASFTLYYVPDPPLVSGHRDESRRTIACFAELFNTFKELEKPMWMLMLVTACNLLAWFPYVLYNTDWMGLEVYVGDASIEAYDAGVRAGALGLMLNSVVHFFTTLGVERLGRCVRGPTRLWGIVNLILAVCLVMTVPIIKVAEHQHHVSGGATVRKPSPGVTASAMIFLSILGVPLVVTYSIPFALASIFFITTGSDKFKIFKLWGQYYNCISYFYMNSHELQSINESVQKQIINSLLNF